MTPHRAKLVLATWRPPPGPNPDPDPAGPAAVSEALRLTGSDPVLARWWEAHQSFQRGTRQALQSLEVPAGLRQAVLDRHRNATGTVRFPRPTGFKFAVGVLVAAAVAVLGIALVLLPRQGAPDFNVFRDRMARAAIREYRMDVTTPDLGAIRSFLAEHQAPADFALPPGLQTAAPVGGGLLSWEGRPVSMVCLKSAALGMLYLFVVDAPASGAPAQPELLQVSRLGTVSWTEGNRLFVLAGATAPEQLQPLIENVTPAPSSPPRGDAAPGRGSVPSCRLLAHGNRGPAQQPVVVGAFVVRQFDR